MRGLITVHAWERETGKQLWTRSTRNTVVYRGLPECARLIAGIGGHAVSVIGFDANTSAPVITDHLTVTPSYFRVLDGASVDAGPTPAQITFNWSINAGATPDYGAKGMVISSIGLWINTTANPLPVSALNPTLPARANGTAYAATPIASTSVIKDSNGNIQACTVAGTSAGSAPSWASTVGATTTDGGVTWKCVALLNDGPLDLFARALMPLGTIAPNVAFSSTWVISM